MNAEATTHAAADAVTAHVRRPEPATARRASIRYHRLLLAGDRGCSPALNYDIVEREKVPANGTAKVRAFDGLPDGPQTFHSGGAEGMFVTEEVGEIEDSLIREKYSEAHQSSMAKVD